MKDSDGTDQLARLSQEVSDLKRTIADRLSNDPVREKAFDQLYEELKQYKEEFLVQAERPLLLDLLLFYDSLQWFQQSLIKQEMSPDVIADSFQYLIDEFLEVLYRRDVMPLDSAARFDRKLHKAVKVQGTKDREADYRIAQVLKRGFKHANKTLRAEEVVIMRYRGPKES